MDLSNRSMSTTPCRGNGDLSNCRGSVPSTSVKALGDGNDCLEMIDSDTSPTPCDAVNPNGMSLSDLMRLVGDDSTVEVGRSVDV